jgi:hypothetical protein
MSSTDSRLSSLNTTTVQSSVPTVTSNGMSLNDKRVRLSMMPNSPEIFYRDSNNTLLSILSSTNGVLFPFQPTVTISYSANYDHQEVTHSNFVYHAYKNSEIKAIDLTCDFPVRTPYEGQYVIAAEHFLRSLTLMFTGMDTNVGSGGIDLSGAPPMVVNLSGMGFGGLDDIPVAITNVTTTYPDNVDYVTISIPGLKNELAKVPTQMTITISAIPMFSRSYASAFGVEDFSNGTTRLLGPNPNYAGSANLVATYANSTVGTISTANVSSDNSSVTNTQSVTVNGGLPTTIQTQTDTSLNDITI